MFKHIEILLIALGGHDTAQKWKRAGIRAAADFKDVIEFREIQALLLAQQIMRSLKERFLLLKSSHTSTLKLQQEAISPALELDLMIKTLPSLFDFDKRDIGQLVRMDELEDAVYLDVILGKRLTHNSLVIAHHEGVIGSIVLCAEPMLSRKTAKSKIQLCQARYLVALSNPAKRQGDLTSSDNPPLKRRRRESSSPVENLSAAESASIAENPSIAESLSIAENPSIAKNPSIAESVSIAKNPSIAENLSIAKKSFDCRKSFNCKESFNCRKSFNHGNRFDH